MVEVFIYDNLFWRYFCQLSKNYDKISINYKLCVTTLRIGLKPEYKAKFYSPSAKADGKIVQ